MKVVRGLYGRCAKKWIEVHWKYIGSAYKHHICANKYHICWKEIDG